MNVRSSLRLVLLRFKRVPYRKLEMSTANRYQLDERGNKPWYYKREYLFDGRIGEAFRGSVAVVQHYPMDSDLCQSRQCSGSGFANRQQPVSQLTMLVVSVVQVVPASSPR